MKNQTDHIIKLLNTNRFLFLLSILPLFSCMVSAQTLQNKQLTPKDYSLWHYLRLNKLSSNGQWLSYGVNYHNQIGRDTLYVKNTNNTKIHIFPGGKQEEFFHPDWFLYYTDKGLHIVNLKSGKQEIVDQAFRHVQVPATGELLILIKNAKTNTLLLRSPNGGITEQIEGVSEFIIDPTHQSVLYITSSNNHYSVNILELNQKNRKTVLHEGIGAYNNLIWHKKGKSLAFAQRNINGEVGNQAIYYYTLEERKLHQFDPQLQIDFPKNSFFIPDVTYKLKISDDMKRVFFTVKPEIKAIIDLQNSKVEVWNGNANRIFPFEQKQKAFESSYLAVWEPLKARSRVISNDTLLKFMLTGDERYAILSDAKQYDTEQTYDGFRDFYIVDAITGEKNLLLKKHYGNSYSTVPSPAGKYIAYFKEKHWWIYDIDKKSHTNITKNVAQSFFNNDKQHPQTIDTYPHLGWTIGDKEILLCDAYDIWAITPDGTSARRLTQGRESQTKFSIAGNYNLSLGEDNYSGRINETIDIGKGLLLESKNEGIISGFYKWSNGSNVKIISSHNSRLDYFKQSANGVVLAYLEQRFDLPPRIMLRSGNEIKPKVFVQSNPQHQQFYWGKSERIQYKNTRGETLKGSLYYPANFDSQRKYPMIVHIYEKLSQHLHDYVNPSQITGEEDGFNVSNFTTQGYFVLMPDISYQIGDVGISAADCVISATKEVIARGLVKPDKIGLIGHSFGGYETDFIITQTDLFAAAIAGAAATDMTSMYLTVGWDNGRPDMWRFESQQWRMGKSLFEDKEAYRRNSPIEQAQRITTPLLSWSGKEDLQVNWSQSIEFYLALRRLGKKHIMLLYPKERHNLSNKENKIDLSRRTQQWFDYHLKDAVPDTWITEGLK